MSQPPDFRSLIILVVASLLLYPFDPLLPAPLSPSQTKQSASIADPQAWFQKGQTALQSGDLDAAEKAFRQVLATDPNAGAAYANLGVVSMRRKDWDAALRNLKKAERLSPKTPGIRLNIALVEFRRQNYREAIPYLQSVVRDDPNSTQAHYLLGLCQVFTLDYAAAANTLDSLWPQLSSDVMYLYVLDMAANRAGDKTLDDKAMKQLVAVGGDSPELHLILGKSYLQHQEYDTALFQLQKALAVNPTL
ncbi:MAG TPA: tetratricopeptide repeat protein, partial [Candidatus Acidoferrum sp.]|nr:tetratricopeptide repeat protein [Candidatus Acidoferrum sp.]